MVAAALVVSALSLLIPWAIAFDAWSWIIWGREVTRLGLDTAGGPSWKPLSVVFTSVFALFGSIAPQLWLVAARAGGLLALGGVAALAHRLAGPVAAAIAPVLMLFSDWWLFHTFLGNSEGMLAAASAWAIVAHLDGRHQAALGLGVAAGLIRPEAWPFAGLYALWAWRRAGMSFWVAAAWLSLLPVLWFGPDLTGSGGALGASDAALAYAAPASAANAAVPVLEVWRDAGGLLTVPVLIAVALAVWLGRRLERVLFAMACAWVLIVGILAQAGYPGNPRYNVPAAVIGCALAADGLVRFARRHAPLAGRRRRRRARGGARAARARRELGRAARPARGARRPRGPAPRPRTRSWSATAAPPRCAPAPRSTPSRACARWWRGRSTSGWRR